MSFEPFTITGAQIVNAYIWAHLLFGLVTHYHSVVEVRKHNQKPCNTQIGSIVMLAYFVVRMCIGLPWFIISRLIAPIGNRWHMSADQIERAW